jgi:protein-L-isoaspartate(D-aspartate) O-methyltransferase
VEHAAGLQQALMDSLERTGVLQDARVEAALRAVPRHVFLPGVPLEEVYRDQAIVTKCLEGVGVSSSSQPAIMAVMLEQLALQPGQRVLEIGAGTGYNAALLAHLVGETGQVVTVDIDADVADAARQHLVTAGFERVQVICIDGGLGYPAAAPYDRIILTVGAWDIAPAWWEQLQPGGRLVLPLALRGPETQRAIAFDRLDDHLASASVRPCGFMLLRGAFAGPIHQVPLRPAHGLRLVHDRPAPVDAEAVFRWLVEPGAVTATGMRANALAVAGGLNLWVALHDDRFCAVIAEGSGVESAPVPLLYGHGQRIRTTVGLLGERGLALLGRLPDQTWVADGDEWSAEAPPFDLAVHSFGLEAGLGQRLRELAVGWDAAGRPAGDRLRVSAYRRDVELVAANPGQVVTKRWTRLVLEWT